MEPDGRRAADRKIAAIGLGSTAKVVICNLVAADSVEERVVARLMEKLQSIAHAIGDIESILELSEWDGDEDRFENQVRELVVKSLLGQNVAKQATRLAQESIERARRQIEEQHTEVDQTLGPSWMSCTTAGPKNAQSRTNSPICTGPRFCVAGEASRWRHRRRNVPPGVDEVQISGLPKTR